jgi:hypothetical protein
MSVVTAADAHGRRWALGLTAAAQFVLQLDLAIVNVALPTVQRELGFTAAGLQWIVTGYALPSARCCCSVGASATCSATAAP